MAQLDASQRATLRHTKGRKPADLQLQGRDAVWASIRRLKTFTVPQLERETRVPQDTIRSYLQGLAAAGYISQPTKTQAKNSRGVPLFQAAQYTLLRDVGVDAPRVTRKGDPVQQGASRNQLWTAMRGLREFDYVDLVATASTPDCTVAENDARDYIKHLAAAGYLQVTRPSKGPHTRARYRLIPLRNTGPKAPQVQRVKQIYDPNLGKVMYREGDQ